MSNEHQNICNMTTTASADSALVLIFFICINVRSGSGAGLLCDAAASGDYARQVCKLMQDSREVFVI